MNELKNELQFKLNELLEECRDNNLYIDGKSIMEITIPRLAMTFNSVFNRKWSRECETWIFEREREEGTYILPTKFSEYIIKNEPEKIIINLKENYVIIGNNKFNTNLKCFKNKELVDKELVLVRDFECYYYLDLELSGITLCNYESWSIFDCSLNITLSSDLKDSYKMKMEIA